jgi:hypothetical protein
MAKEEIYKQQLQDLGVYDPAFDPAIHVLCIQERELSRAMKAWKATAANGAAPLITDPLYQEISKLRRDILARQDALGLTPKGLQRLRKNAAPTSSDAAPIAGTPNQGFAALMNKLQETAHAGK